MKVVRERKRAMMRWLAESEVMNTQHDLVISMKDCWEASNANPVNRRNEMMVRMRGFEDYAEEQGHVGSSLPGRHLPAFMPGHRNTTARP